MIEIGGHRFEALACGAIFWPAEQTLVVADLHLEKGSALARAGWLVPPYDSRATLERLRAAVAATAARRVVALGDSFHDPAGAHRLEPGARALLAALATAVEFVWIAGNHDQAAGAAFGGRAVRAWWHRGVAFRHETNGRGPELSGHFHPKVRIALPGGVRTSRRCHARVGDRLVLAAYGAYAGGLDVASTALAGALGGRPTALVPTPRGLLALEPLAP